VRRRAGNLPRVTLAALALVFLLGGCANFARLPPPPPAATVALDVLGLPNARFWIDGDPAPFAQEGALLAARRVAAEAPVGGRLRPAHFLALSGGGDNGAFGAGVLTGWTASGTRPEFDVVTGISAGALIAPFAFLGPAYDPQLRRLFTEVSSGDVLIFARLVQALLFGEALADTSPLSRLIELYLDEDMLAAIAREYGKGRMLLIGTTNLDVQRPVVWNIGAIAASGDPRALDLIRRILLASAAIPGAFPPVLIDVELNGQSHQEMHVDGGAATQVFLYPPALNLRQAARGWGAERERTAWVIRNGRIDVEGASTGRSLFRITARSVETLLHFSGIADIYRIYLTTLRDGVGFRLAVIGRDFDADRPEPFDQAYMQALFAHGEAQGRAGDAWLRNPPGVRIITREAQP
jgi:hypothetical protein